MFCYVAVSVSFDLALLLCSEYKTHWVWGKNTLHHTIPFQQHSFLVNMFLHGTLREMKLVFSEFCILVVWICSFWYLWYTSGAINGRSICPNVSTTFRIILCADQETSHTVVQWGL